MIPTWFTLDLDSDGLADPSEPKIDMGLMPPVLVNDWITKRRGQHFVVIRRRLVEGPDQRWSQELLVTRQARR